MSVQYKGVGWNRQKKIYDAVVVGCLLTYVTSFVAAGLLLRPNGTIETLLIRGLGTAAILLLHIVLAIGPLSRLDRRFLPLLYNRRHLGVTTFLVALSHGAFSIVQFHALGDKNPLVSVLTSNPRWDSISQFPFQPLGLAALSILFLMAATSHDFWLANLTAPVWKLLHMAVYLAYGLVLLHVGLGVLQAETSPVLVAVLAAGALALLALHVAAALRERVGASGGDRRSRDRFVEVCAAAEIPEKGARIVSIGNERIAVFRYDGNVSAISNVCQHQNGPLGEGRIVNGCVVCPWHGYEYNPRDGASPAPFSERVSTFEVRVEAGNVCVDPTPKPPGTPIDPARIDATADDASGPFYVGYRPHTAPELARWIRRVAAALLALALGLPWLLVAAEGSFSDAVFEYGTVRELSGVLRADPYPVLHTTEEGGQRPHHLVRFGKAGGQSAVAGLDGRTVEAAGQLIYRDDQWMLELSDGEIAPTEESPLPSASEESLGRHRLVGEIVDSKCYLGVMKPGRGKPHRACAARCISGGIAPIFIVTDRSGATRHLLLVGDDERPLHAEVLSMVAEPLEIEGEVVRSDGLFYLRAEPARFRRVGESR